MSLFQFRLEEILIFFMIFVRYHVLLSILPFIGDKFIPSHLKILFSLIISIGLFPILLASKRIQIHEVNNWGKSISGIFNVLGLEIFFSLLLGFSVRLIFECISFGANFLGVLMGFSQMSIYNPHQEVQTEVIAQFQNALAMLIFLSINGHHTMLRAVFESYRIVGMGKFNFCVLLSQRVVQMSSEVFHLGLQIAAPVFVSLFSVNILTAILAKAIPQFNVFIFSFGVSTFVGFITMYLNVSEFLEMIIHIFDKMGEWIESILILSKGE